jgi:O-antigen/teichoic acid export membrane protein
VLKSLHKSPLTALLFANLVGTVVGGLYFVVASRRLSLGDMGLYTAAISLQLIFTSIVGGGLHVATVRLGAGYLRRQRRPEAAGLVALSLLLTAALALLAAGLGLALSGTGILGLTSLRTALLLTAGWAGSRTLVNCELAGLLAQQRPRLGAGLMLLGALTGLLSLGAAVFGGPLTLTRLLLAHALGMGANALFGLLFLLPLGRAGVALRRDLLRELLTYARWPALSQGADALQAHLAPFLVIAWAGAAAAGLFALGRYPAFVFGVVTTALYQYWLPAASLQQGHAQFSGFFSRQIRLAAVMGVGMVLCALVASPLLSFLGPNFAGARLLFLVNALDFAAQVLTKPVDAVYHGLHKPQLELWRRLGRLPVMLALAVLLVPRYGALGMAWTQLASGLAALLLGAALLRSEFRVLLTQEVPELPPEETLL